MEGQLRPVGRVAIVVSRYNELVTARLLDGARACCRAAGIADDALDVAWVPGAFELGVAVATAARSGRYACVVALGAVVRGDTPHFDFVAGEASRALNSVALETGRPVGFGLLTTNDLDQALARAGGAAGNKGYEAAEAAIRAADLVARLGGAR
ncbi:MAG TPA: 6,7-dimethyl-8-ribityllumazine synthase [Gemmatimonadales bacterium]|nr:6,7-dimethyl-8-ribityllumazine synthase [Gemmatimonadales bacterium]